MAWPLVASRINQQIENIVTQAKADSYELYLTGEGNFREAIATIKPYKGNRPSDKPFHYDRIRDYLIKFRKSTLVEGIEADDAVSIKAYQDLVATKAYNEKAREDLTPVLIEADVSSTIICTVDKDLDNTPGWHYNWNKDERYWIDETTALRNFYCQLLTGDGVDNILGLYGVGKSSKLLSDVRNCDDELGMFSIVRDQYEKRFGSGYWWQFLLENAQLLWILREYPYAGEEIPRSKDTGYTPEEEIENRLRALEEKRFEGSSSL